MKNNNKITEVPDEVLGQEPLNPKTNTEDPVKGITELPDGVETPDYEKLTSSQMPDMYDDRVTDASKFDFQLKIGGDNEEIRAQNQSLGQLFGNAAIQTAAVAIGGAIEGTGYMADLFLNTPELIGGDEVNFDNIVTKFGKGIQEYASEELAPVYQTRRAQEGGMQALGDATYLAGNMPTIASSFAIMAPTYAITRALAISGRALKGTRAGRAAGETVAENLSPAIRQALGSRKAQGIVNHLGNTVLSRHTYNSLEANDTFQQMYQERIQEGDDETTARKKAGQAAAYMYRGGYVNIWKDALQWKVILGTRYSSARATQQPWFTKAGRAAGTSMADRRRLVELGKRFPGGRIPQRAMMQAGIAGKKGKEALKALGKMGLAEGFEEINIQHQKKLAMDYVDLITGADSSEPLTGWGDIYGNMIPGYAGSFADFTFDEDTIISSEAFDAAFWAFMSGATMGGLMKAGQSFADKKLGSSADNMAKQKAELDYFKAQTASYQQAIAQNNDVLADQIYDEIVFAMGIKGFNEGNTHVEGALSEARFEDLLKSLEAIIQADDTTLENSGISNDPEMRQMYERMYADLQSIEQIFEKNFATKAGFGDAYDRQLATAQTYYEFQKKRWNERVEDMKGKRADVESKIDNSIFEEGYEAIAKSKIDQEALKQARSIVEMYLEDLQKYEPTTKGEVESKKRQVIERKKQLEIIDDNLKRYKEEEKEHRQGVEKSEQQEKIVQEYVDTQAELVQLRSDIAQYDSAVKNIQEKQKELSTREGQKEYVNRIKKSQKENLNNERVAKIELAQTLESLDDIDLEGTSAETKRVFNDKRNVLKRRDQEVKKVKKPKINESHIEEINEKIPFFETAEQLNEFNEQIDSQEDLHGNTQKAIKKYATEVFEASQRGQQIELSKQEARDLKKKLIKDKKQNHVTKLESISDPAEALDYIEKSGLPPEEKRELKSFYKKTLIAKMDRISNEDLKLFEEAKEESEVRKGKKPAFKPEEADFDIASDVMGDGRPVPPLPIGMDTSDIQGEQAPIETADTATPKTEPKEETQETKEEDGPLDPNDLQFTKEDTKALLDEMFPDDSKPKKTEPKTPKKKESKETKPETKETEFKEHIDPSGIRLIHKDHVHKDIDATEDLKSIVAKGVSEGKTPHQIQEDVQKKYKAPTADFRSVRHYAQQEIDRAKLEGDTQAETKETPVDREGIPTEYKGVNVVIDTTIPYGGKASRGKGKKPNRIRMNPVELKKAYKEKKWANPRKIQSKKGGQLLMESSVEPLPLDFFESYEKFLEFVMEHERQHLLVHHTDFFNQYPDLFVHHYEQHMNELALKELGYDTDKLFDAPWIGTKGKQATGEDAPKATPPRVESTESKVTKTKADAAEKGNNRIFTLAKVQYNFYKGEDKLQFKLENGKLSVKPTKYALSNRDIDFSETANPNLNKGAEIEVVLQENDFSKKNNDNASHPLAIVDKKTGKKVGLMKAAGSSANADLRKAITQALKDGKEVTATITSKEDVGDNLNNIVIGGKPYFRSVNTFKNRWVEKEDGTWVKEETPVVITTSDGTGDARLLSIDTEYFDFLSDKVKDDINRSIEGTPLESKDGFKFDGHAWAVIAKPDGTYRAVKLLTQNLTQPAINAAYEAIINNDKELASQIVFIDSSPITNPDRNLYLEVTSAPSPKTVGKESVDLNMIRYFDENAGTIIQISKTASDKKFTIKQLKADVEVTNSMKKEDFEIRTEPLDYEDGLKKLLANKKYNISRERAGQMDVKYTSPVNPDNEYANYYEYLTSNKEIDSVSSDFQGDNDAKSIIATDIYNDNGSFSSNVGVQIEINDIEGTKQQQQTQKEEVITQKNTQVEEKTEETPDTPTPKRRKRERKTKADFKLEEAYNESSELQKKYVSLQDFKDKYIYDEAPNIDLFIKSEIERIKNNC